MSKKQGKKKFVPLDMTVTCVQQQSWADMENERESSDMDLSQITQLRQNLPSAPKAIRAQEDVARIPMEGPFKAYVGNIPFDAEEEQLIEFFSPLSVVSVNLVTTGSKLRGFGYVQFEKRDDLVQALQKSDNMLNGRKIKIDLAESGDKDKNSEGGFHGYSRGGERPQGQADMNSNWRDRSKTDDKGGRFNDDRGSRYDDNRGGGDRFGNRDGGDRFGNRDGGDRFGNRDGGRGFSDRRYEDGGRSGYQQDRRREDRGGYQDRRDDRGSFPDRRHDDRGGGYQERRHDDRGSGYQERRQDDRGGSYQDRRRYDDESRGGGNRGGYSDRRDTPTRTEESDVSAPAHSNDDAPRERPRLNLAKRTKPVSEIEASSARQASIFGDAKPVDTLVKEMEIEEKIKRDREDILKSDVPENQQVTRSSGNTNSRLDSESSSTGTGRQRLSSGGSGGTVPSVGTGKNRRVSEDDSHPSESPPAAGPKSTSPVAAEFKMVPAPPPAVNPWTKKQQPPYASQTGSSHSQQSRPAPQQATRPASQQQARDNKPASTPAKSVDASGRPVNAWARGPPRAAEVASDVVVVSATNGTVQSQQRSGNSQPTQNAWKRGGGHSQGTRND